MASYSEKLIATVELNLSDFREKMHAADAAVDAVAKSSDKKVERTGNRTFTSTGNAMIDAAITAMNEFAQEVMGDSIFECPEDTGVLVESARVEGAVKEGKRIKVRMGYGYGDAINPKTKRTADQYALPVHEIYYAEHQAPTKDHYLIDPLLQHARSYGSDLGLSMRMAAEGRFEKYRTSRGITELELGSSIETREVAIGGGFSHRGGNPANIGQFSKRPKK